METNKDFEFQARGCIQLGDLLIFAFGAFIMFAKTADVLGKFAPTDWFGLSPTDYGFAAAILIEGFLVWRKVKMWLLPPKNLVEWFMDLFTSFIPFGLSLAAQVIDGFLTTGLINGMDEAEKIKITAIVSSLIGVTILLDLGKTAVENAPAGLFDAFKNHQGGGLGVLANVAKSFGKRFGAGNKREMVALAKDVEQEVLANPEESVGKRANPTKGKVRRA